jgi:hypothetical protein
VQPRPLGSQRRLDFGDGTRRRLLRPGQPSPEPSPTPPSGSDGVSDIENRPGVRGTAEQVINFFMAKGLTRAQAAGIAANLR